MEAMKVVSTLIRELESLPERKTAPMREVRRRYSQTLLAENAQYVLEIAHMIVDTDQHRWIAYELIADHPEAFHALNRGKLEALGRGMDCWSVVDSYSRTLSGPAWRDGLISTQTIHDWAHSPDRWWRRAALVSTVALNVRTRGGAGDVSRTLAVCEMLVDDHDDMIVKAMSWALRELVPHDAEAVRHFLSTHKDKLAARVKREVRNVLETGLKNPRYRSHR
jgi:3-methyladenine DNA glycosylase AlkD